MKIWAYRGALRSVIMTATLSLVASFASAQSETRWYQDFDNDTYGSNTGRSILAVDQPVGFVSDNSDCNDFDDKVNPNATEIDNNNIDEDCDGSDGGGGTVPSFSTNTPLTQDYTDGLRAVLAVSHTLSAPTFVWTKQSGPDITNPSSTTESVFSFDPAQMNAGDEPDIYTFSVTVTDQGLSSTQTVSYQVNAPKSEPPTTDPEDQVTAVSEGTKTIQSNILGASPNLIGIARGNGQGSFSADATSSSGSLALLTDPDYPIWFQLKGSWSEIDGVDTRYVLGSVGAHTRAGNNTVVGGILQFDDYDVDASGDEITGQGVMAGPYIVGQFPNAPLFYEARILAGTTRNDIVLSGSGAEASYETDRWMAIFALEGSIPSNGFEIRPNLTMARITDDVEAYTDSLANDVLGQEIVTDRVEAGLDVYIPILSSAGTTEFTIGASGVWSRQSSDAAGSSDTEYSRGRIDAGIISTAVGNGRLNSTIFFEGLGEDDFEQYGIDFKYEFRF